MPVHLAGHIHEAYGYETVGQTFFANASTCTLKYRCGRREPWVERRPTNPPLLLDLPPPEQLQRRA